MSPNYPLSYTKARYGEIFHAAQRALDDRLYALRAGFSCPDCPEPPDALLTSLHEDCGFKGWQQAALNVVEQEIGREILERLEQVQAYKKAFSCHMCGVCCRMGSSEYSYEELLNRAEAGDDFARQFTGIFLPYASTEAARKRMPDVVESVLAEVGDALPVYFYHCPYVGEDNRCSIYGTPKRPAICESYPDTPLTFMYQNCAWKPWKDATHPDTLLAHAMTELCTHLSKRLRELINAPADAAR